MGAVVHLVGLLMALVGGVTSICGVVALGRAEWREPSVPAHAYRRAAWILMVGGALAAWGDRLASLHP